MARSVDYETAEPIFKSNKPKNKANICFLRCSVLPHWLFSNRQLSKGIFANGNFPSVPFPKRQLPKAVLAAALDPLAHPCHSTRPTLQPAVPQKVLPNLWEVVVWEIVTWETVLRIH